MRGVGGLHGAADHARAVAAAAAWADHQARLGAQTLFTQPGEQPLQPRLARPEPRAEPGDGLPCGRRRRGRRGVYCRRAPFGCGLHTSQTSEKFKTYEVQHAAVD